MKKFLLIVYIICLPMMLFAQQPNRQQNGQPLAGQRANATPVGLGKEVFKNDEITIYVIDEHTWIGKTTKSGELYIIEGSEKAILYDVGTEVSNLDKIVSSITSKPITLVVSHIHPDHAGSAINYYSKIYFHPADTVLMDWVMPDYKGEIMFVKDGDVFDLGGRKLVVVHAPGHTPGSILLNDYAAGYCFSGDAFGGGGVWLQVMPILPLSVYLETCEMMETLMQKTGLNKIYGGHYRNVIYDIEYIRNMKHLTMDIIDGKIVGEPYNAKRDIFSKHPINVRGDGGVSIIYEADMVNY